jgi:peptide deformylase
MALRKIRIEGDEVLRKICKPVEKIDDRLGLLVGDLLDTLNDTSNGVGLAASQIGVLRSVIVIKWADDPEAEPETIVAVNPEILSEEGEVVMREGCLSIPEYSGEVARPEKIRVTYRDAEGREATRMAEGFLARVFCHEIDHLKGRLYKDIATDFKKDSDPPQD